MKKFYLLLILGLSASYFTHAQEWVFAKQFASTGDVTPTDIRVDASGDIYVVGNYINALTIGGTSLPYSDLNGKEDIYVCKFDNNGNVLWAKQIASSTRELVGGIAIDLSDNIYVVGAFQGDTLRFQGETTELINTESPGGGKYDAFVAKYSTDGTLLAADRVFYGTSVERLLDATYDKTNDYVVVVGQFQGELQYDSAGVQTLPAVGPKDHLLARIDTDLGFVDKVVLNGDIKQSTIKNVNNCVIADTVNSYFVTGDLLGNLFNASSDLLLTAPDVAAMDIMVLKFDNTLGFVWGRTGGGSSYDHVNSSGSDAFGNIYFTGKAQSPSIVIDSTETLSSASRPSLGGQDYLIAKYNRDGNLQWFNREGGPGTDNAYGLSVRGRRLLYSGNIDSSGNINSGFAVYDLDGNIIAQDLITGDGEESGLNVIFDKSGDSTLVIGTFDGDSLKAGPFRLDNTLSGVTDGFLVKYGYEFRVYGASSTDILCKGDSSGSIEVETEFGTPPITYEWIPNVSTTNIATDLPAGAYKIVASGAGGRKDSITITLTEPDDLATALVTSTPTSCNVLASSGNKNDGALDIDVTGGVGPYTYLWSPGGQTVQDITNEVAGEHVVTVTDANSCVEVDTFLIDQPTKVSHDGTTIDLITDPPGDNGAIHLSTTGGTPAYTFSWTGPIGYVPSTDDTIKDLQYPGNYELEVTDANSCKFDSTFVIPSPDTCAIVATICDYQHVSCKDEEDGYAKVCVTSKSEGPFSYAWRKSSGTSVGTNSPELLNQPAGTYIVVVTDLSACGRKDSTDITIIEPETFLSIGLDSTWDASCNGYDDGALFISVTGGWGGYSYQWTPTGKVTQDIYDLTAGKYSVQVADTGLNTGTCVKQLADIAIIEPTAVVANIVVGNEISCFGGSDGSLTSNVTGGTEPYGYVWDDLGAQTTPTATNLPAGTFTCNVLDANDCPATDQGTLTEPDQLMIDSVVKDDVALEVTIYVSGGTSPYTYSITGETPVVEAGNSYTFASLSGGEYTVLVDDANLCGPAKDTVIALYVSNFVYGVNVKLYPNPTNGQFTIELDNERGEDMILEIMNLTGQMVYKKLYPYNGNSRIVETLDMGSQSRGVYMLRVNGNPINNKLMIY